MMEPATAATLGAERLTCAYAQVVPGWRLEATLASTARSRVHRATHASGARGVVKVIVREEDEERLLREIALTDGASTIGAPRLRGYGARYLVLEYVPGRTLAAHRAARGGRFDLATALLLTERLLGFLTRLHGLGIAHRDVTPDNIYLTSFAEVRLLDYSEAVAGGDESDVDVRAACAVLAWMLAGTTRWAPPVLDWLDDLAHLPCDVLDFLDRTLATEPLERVSAVITRSALLSMHAACSGLSRGRSD